MTPQESELIAELFDRLAQLENSPRDADAERAIAEGLRRAPHGAYALVQTVLVQDEALKAADARIRALQAAQEGQQPSVGGFLGSMRDSLLGRREAPRSGSVPQVRPESRPAESSPWNQGPMQPPPPQYGPGPGGGPFGGGAPAGGSFLGNAAATAAGVVGGGLLLESIRSMFGGHRPGASAAYAEPGSGGGSPWSGGGGGSDQLSRDAGLGDISGGRSAGIGHVDEHDHGGAYDTADHDADHDNPDESDTDEDYDYEDDGGDDGDGDTDYA
jgi:hypothetical protein